MTKEDELLAIKIALIINMMFIDKKGLTEEATQFSKEMFSNLSRNEMEKIVKEFDEIATKKNDAN